MAALARMYIDMLGIRLYAERDESDNLQIKKFKDATWKFPDGEHFLEYISRINVPRTYIGEYLGRGAYATAYLITKGDTQFVLKVIESPRYSYNSFSYDDVINEIYKLRDVGNSPYVVKLLAGVLITRKAYLLFPYIPGSTLNDWLGKDPPPTREDLIRVYN